MANLQLQLADYRLTTAEIIYRLPDHPDLLQSFVWQELDLAPKFPVLRKFLNYWEKNLDGKLFEVKIAHQKLITPGNLRFASAEFLVH
jgi:uncharacterized protein Usg